MRGILQKLAYKATEAGTRLVEVPTQKVKPSQTCPICLRQEKKPLAQRMHSCPCGCEMSRDRAAALVMLRWALDPRVYGPSPSREGIYPRVYTHERVPKGIYPWVYGQPPVPKGIYPWEPGGGEGLRSGPVEPQSPDHTAIAVGRG
ncbi:hypothetical protein MGR01S_23420 [Meiothermus granaticius NBRC 107808]|nr:hypothetical protein MGR01S_23420 [Meiothermus granaticius NBRC 107808]